MLKYEKWEFRSKSDQPYVGLCSKYWERSFHQAVLKIVFDYLRTPACLPTPKC